MTFLTILRRTSLGFLMLLAIGVTACGGTTTTDAPVGGTTAAGGDTANSGDEPNVVYTDPAGKFSFSHPRSWTPTTQPTETIRFTGRDEFISLTLVTTSLSPLDYARQDSAPLTAASPGFQGGNPATAHIAGRDGATISYTWNAGPSPVTGKLIPSSANRYYIPGATGTLAVYTYSSPTRTYDPNGAVDFVNTFTWR